MAWSRASGLDRTLQCPGHLTLPHKRELSERALDAAEYGTMVHRWAETGAISGKKSHVKTFEKKLDILQANGVTRQSLWIPTGYHEVTFSYNCVDGRVGVCWLKGEGALEFKQQHDDDWITGTADFVFMRDGVCGVNDLKTGMMFDSQPDELSQLYFYLMCWRKYCGAAPESDGILSVTHWPKYPLGALPVEEERIVKGSLMVKFENYLKKVHSEYKKGNSPFELGSECEYCPAIQDCPLQNQERNV